VPIVPVIEKPADDDATPSFWPSALAVLLIVAILGLGGWYLTTRRSTSPATTTGANGQIADYSIVVDSEATVMAEEEARIDVKLTNNSLWKQTVGVGILGDDVFAASGARRIIEIGSHASEIVSLPFSARTRGTWEIRVGLFDDKDALIGTAARPLAVVEPPFHARVYMGENAAITVPKNGRVYAYVQWDTLGATSTIPLVNIHVSSTPDRTVALKNVAPGRRGSFIVWTTVPPAARGNFVKTSDLGLEARTTWIDASGKEHATRTAPNASAVGVIAFARLYDSHGKRMSDGPLPFTAGVESKFWINLGMSRDTRDAKSVLMRAHLADGVEFTGRTWVNNKDRFSYDAATRELVWQTKPLRANDPSEPLVGFEVRMTPSADSVGTMPVVLTGVTADRIPDANTARHDTETGPVLADFRFDAFAAAENSVRK
jgi:hypothetical protein